jgi:hypothetical protein
VSALNRRLGGIERRCVDPPMMLAMCVRSYVVAVSYGSVLERDVLALDHTRVSVKSKNAAKTANQAKNNKQNKKNRKTFFYFLFFIRNRDKIKQISKIEILIITSRQIKSIYT